MMEFKYIIINWCKYVLFTHAIEHKFEANGRNVTSAGFCKFGIEDGVLKVECFGHSTSLNIGSKEHLDAKLIHNIATSNMGTGGE